MRFPTVQPKVFLIAIAILSLSQIAMPLLISPALVRGDAVGYYSYLRSAVIDKDLHFENEFSYFRDALPDSALMSTLHLDGPRTETDHVPNHWPLGAAVLWSPFFLAAHASSAMFGLPMDGYAMHYQVAVALGSVMYGMLGLLLLYRVLRRFYGEESSVLALLSVWGASSLTAYMYFMPVWSHTSSFLAISLLAYLWTEARDANRVSNRTFFAMGAVCGLAAIIRHQDILFGSILAIEWFRHLRSSPKQIAAAISSAAFIAAGVLLAMLPQFIAWQILYGHPYPTAYAPGSEFDWSAPYLKDVLFRPRYGLLLSTPIFLLALFGIPRLWNQDRQLLGTLGAVFLVQFWVVASFIFYSGGNAFGPRYFISTLPLVALLLGAVYQRLGAAVGRWPGRILMLGLVGWNYLLLALYGFELIPRGANISWARFFGSIGGLFEKLLG